jgi:hypothetical protein
MKAKSARLNQTLMKAKSVLWPILYGPRLQRWVMGWTSSLGSISR